MIADAFNPKSFAVGISNYRRPQSLFRTLLGWMQTTPPGTRIYILHNTWQDENEVFDAVCHAEYLDDHKHPVSQVIDHTRHRSHWGCLAESWNTLIQHILDDHEWVILSQDDVIINDGWMKLLETNPYYYYQGNVGDQVVCFGRELFNLMPQRGWYDQRIRMVGVHDMDFAKRVIRTVGLKGVCIESVCDGFINPIGLYDKWRMADQHTKSEISVNRTNAQEVRSMLSKDEEGNLQGLDGREDVVSKDCSQYVLVNRGVGDTRPYVDTVLDWFKTKWGGWGIDEKAPGQDTIRQFVDNGDDPTDFLPANYLAYYKPVRVWDPEEDVWYWETGSCSRFWKEGTQTIPDIDWHPYFKPGKVRT
jgi:hypothetical protein